MNRSVLRWRNGKLVLTSAAAALAWLAAQLLMPAGFHIQRALRSSPDDAHWIDRALFSTVVSRIRLMSLPISCETRVIEWTDSLIPAIDEVVPTLSLTTSHLLQITAVEGHGVALTPFASDLLLRTAKECLETERSINSGPYSNAPALMLAVADGNYAIAEVLVAAGADPEEIYTTPRGSASSPVELARKLAQQAKKDSNTRAVEEFSRIVALLSGRSHHEQEAEGGLAKGSDDSR